MDALVALDRHVGDHRVANGYRCRDLDDVLTFQKSGNARDINLSRPRLVLGCWGWASVVGHVTTYHRLSMWDYFTQHAGGVR